MGELVLEDEHAVVVEDHHAARLSAGHEIDVPVVLQVDQRPRRKGPPLHIDAPKYATVLVKAVNPADLCDGEEVRAAVVVHVAHGEGRCDGASRLARPQ